MRIASYEEQYFGLFIDATFNRRGDKEILHMASEKLVLGNESERVFLSPDWTRLATTGLQIQDATSRACVLSLDGGDPVTVDQMSWSPDGTRLAGWHEEGWIWDAHTGTRLRVLRSGDDIGFDSLCWSPNGTRLAGWRKGGGPVRIWDANTGAQLFVVDEHERRMDISNEDVEDDNVDVSINSVSWNPDGSQLAGWHRDGPLRIWDAITGEELFFWEDYLVPDVYWSPDGTRIAMQGNLDNEIEIWNVKTGDKLLALKCDNDVGGSDSLWSGRSACWSPDGKCLAIGGREGAIRIWDAEIGVELNRLGLGGLRNNIPYAFRNKFVVQMKWSPNGKWLAIGDEEGTVRLWDAHSGGPLVALGKHDTDGILNMNWSPDSTQLATVRAKDPNYAIKNIFDAQASMSCQVEVHNLDAITNTSWPALPDCSERPRH